MKHKRVLVRLYHKSNEQAEKITKILNQNVNFLQWFSAINVGKGARTGTTTNLSSLCMGNTVSHNDNCNSVG